jgi:hypothetical protein
MCSPAIKRRRGSTVPEMVIVSVAFVLLLTGLVATGVNSAKEYAYGSSKLQADNNASLGLQELANEVRDGIRASVCTERDHLTVTFPVKNAAGDYDRYVDGQTFTYGVYNGYLYRVSGGWAYTSSSQVLSKGVESVRFAVNGTQVQIELVARKQVGNKTSSSTFRTQVTLRKERL